jgi:5'-3' exonuclease
MMYRAFFAMGDTMATADGRPIGAVHGYLDMVATLVARRRPGEVVHCYDHDWRPVARTDIYPGYKAHRPPDPEALPPQFAMLRQVLDLTEMTQAQTRGWEAEDAIGAFCVDARDDDRVEIVSGDRDLIQLVRDPVVKLLFTVRGVSELREYDEAAVVEKYGVAPSRYSEFAILRGDPSDGLPGVKGVGEKTAAALVAAHPSLDAIIEEAARDEPQNPGPFSSKPALRSKISESTDYIRAMERLVPVNWSAPLDLWAGERDDEGLASLAAELGVRGPARRLRAALDSAANA